jgi:hypothetical protein
MDQELGTSFSLLFPTRLNINTKYPPKVKYKPMFVKDRDMFPNKGAFKLIKSLISNWSNGLIMFNNVFIVLVINYKCTEK